MVTKINKADLMNRVKANSKAKKRSLGTLDDQKRTASTPAKASRQRSTDTKKGNNDETPVYGLTVGSDHIAPLFELNLEDPILFTENSSGARNVSAETASATPCAQQQQQSPRKITRNGASSKLPSNQSATRQEEAPTQPTSLSKQSAVVARPRDCDILCGSQFNLSHPGNNTLQTIVQGKAHPGTREAPDIAQLASSVMQDLKAMDPSCRFLWNDPISGLWWELDNEKALEVVRTRLEGVLTAAAPLPLCPSTSIVLNREEMMSKTKMVLNQREKQQQSSSPVDVGQQSTSFVIDSRSRPNNDQQNHPPGPIKTGAPLSHVQENQATDIEPIRLPQQETAANAWYMEPNRMQGCEMYPAFRQAEQGYHQPAPNLHHPPQPYYLNPYYVYPQPVQGPYLYPTVHRYTHPTYSPPRQRATKNQIRRKEPSTRTSPLNRNQNDSPTRDIMRLASPIGRSTNRKRPDGSSPSQHKSLNRQQEPSPPICLLDGESKDGDEMLSSLQQGPANAMLSRLKRGRGVASSESEEADAATKRKRLVVGEHLDIATPSVQQRNGSVSNQRTREQLTVGQGAGQAHIGEAKRGDLGSLGQPKGIGAPVSLKPVNISNRNPSVALDIDDWGNTTGPASMRSDDEDARAVPIEDDISWGEESVQLLEEIDDDENDSGAVLCCPLHGVVDDDIDVDGDDLSEVGSELVRDTHDMDVMDYLNQTIRQDTFLASIEHDLGFVEESAFLDRIDAQITTFNTKIDEPGVRVIAGDDAHHYDRQLASTVAFDADSNEILYNQDVCHVLDTNDTMVEHYELPGGTETEAVARKRVPKYLGPAGEATFTPEVLSWMVWVVRQQLPTSLNVHISARDVPHDDTSVVLEIRGGQAVMEIAKELVTEVIRTKQVQYTNPEVPRGAPIGELLEVVEEEEDDDDVPDVPADLVHFGSPAEGSPRIPPQQTGLTQRSATSSNKGFAAPSNNAAFAYHAFSAKFAQLREIEFDSLGIDKNHSSGAMWKAHVRHFGKVCDDDCACALSPHLLVETVVSEYVAKKRKKDARWVSHFDEGMACPAGFATNFAAKFMELLGQEFPREKPRQILGRLFLMWDRHKSQKRFGLQCRDGCECTQAWEIVFLKGALHPDESGSASTGTDSAARIPKRSALARSTRFTAVPRAISLPEPLQTLQVQKPGAGAQAKTYDVAFSCDKPLGMYIVSTKGKCRIFSIDPNVKLPDTRLCPGTVFIQAKVGQQGEWSCLKSPRELEYEFERAKKGRLSLIIRCINSKVTSPVRSPDDWGAWGQWKGLSSPDGWAGGAEGLVSKASQRRKISSSQRTTGVPGKTTAEAEATAEVEAVAQSIAASQKAVPRAEKEVKVKATPKHRTTKPKASSLKERDLDEADTAKKVRIEENSNHFAEFKAADPAAVMYIMMTSESLKSFAKNDQNTGYESHHIIKTPTEVLFDLVQGTSDDFTSVLNQLQNGADPCEKDEHGNRPELFAKKAGLVRSVRLLKTHSILIDALKAVLSLKYWVMLEISVHSVKNLHVVLPSAVTREISYEIYFSSGNELLNRDDQDRPICSGYVELRNNIEWQGGRILRGFNSKRRKWDGEEMLEVFLYAGRKGSGHRCQLGSITFPLAELRHCKQRKGSFLRSSLLKSGELYIETRASETRSKCLYEEKQEEAATLVEKAVRQASLLKQDVELNGDGRLNDILTQVHIPGTAYTLLHAAVQVDNDDLVKMLVEAGANPRQQCHEAKCSPLSLAERRLEKANNELRRASTSDKSEMEAKRMRLLQILSTLTGGTDMADHNAVDGNVEDWSLEGAIPEDSQTGTSDEMSTFMSPLPTETPAEVRDTRFGQKKELCVRNDAEDVTRAGESHGASSHSPLGVLERATAARETEPYEDAPKDTVPSRVDRDINHSPAEDDKELGCRHNREVALHRVQGDGHDAVEDDYKACHTKLGSLPELGPMDVQGPHKNEKHQDRNSQNRSVLNLTEAAEQIRIGGNGRPAINVDVNLGEQQKESGHSEATEPEPTSMQDQLSKIQQKKKSEDWSSQGNREGQAYMDSESAEARRRTSAHAKAPDVEPNSPKMSNRQMAGSILKQINAGIRERPEKREGVSLEKEKLSSCADDVETMDMQNPFFWNKFQKKKQQQGMESLRVSISESAGGAEQSNTGTGEKPVSKECATLEEIEQPSSQASDVEPMDMQNPLFWNKFQKNKHQDRNSPNLTHPESAGGTVDQINTGPRPATSERLTLEKKDEQRAHDDNVQAMDMQNPLFWSHFQKNKRQERNSQKVPNPKSGVPLEQIETEKRERTPREVACLDKKRRPSHDSKAHRQKKTDLQTHQYFQEGQQVSIPDSKAKATESALKPSTSSDMDMSDDSEHGDSRTRNLRLNWMHPDRQFCKFFASGCRHGRNCSFSHVANKVVAVSSSSSHHTDQSERIPLHAIKYRRCSGWYTAGWVDQENVAYYSQGGKKVSVNQGGVSFYRNKGDAAQALELVVNKYLAGKESTRTWMRHSANLGGGSNASSCSNINQMLSSALGGENSTKMPQPQTGGWNRSTTYQEVNDLSHYSDHQGQGSATSLAPGHPKFVPALKKATSNSDLSQLASDASHSSHSAQSLDDVFSVLKQGVNFSALYVRIMRTKPLKRDDWSIQQHKETEEFHARFEAATGGGRHRLEFRSKENIGGSRYDSRWWYRTEKEARASAFDDFLDYAAGKGHISKDKRHISGTGAKIKYQM